MSKEELSKRWLDNRILEPEEWDALVKDTKEFLAQPEPEQEPDMRNHKEPIFVVTAYRWGDKECHSYVVGAFDNLELSVEAAIAENSFRGGKYECEVVSMNLNDARKYNNYKVEYKIPKV